jgi:formate dehydrogenase subunit gamma
MFKEYKLEDAVKIIDENANLRGGLVQTLRTLTDVFGYINSELHEKLAETFNISVAGVLGVVTFYHDFKTKPRAKNVIKVCMAEGCYARKSTNMVKVLCDTLDIGVGEQDAAGEFEIEEVFCLGNCAVGPNIMVNDKIVAHVTAENIKEILQTRARESQNEN